MKFKTQKLQILLGLMNANLNLFTPPMKFSDFLQSKVHAKLGTFFPNDGKRF